jgi:hypothetical protein
VFSFVCRAAEAQPDQALWHMPNRIQFQPAPHARDAPAQIAWSSGLQHPALQRNGTKGTRSRLTTRGTSSLMAALKWSVASCAPQAASLT